MAGVTVNNEELDAGALFVGRDGARPRQTPPDREISTRPIRNRGVVAGQRAACQGGRWRICYDSNEPLIVIAL
jgi:hypothetical protein